jgi:hypothetical protein
MNAKAIQQIGSTKAEVCSGNAPFCFYPDECRTASSETAANALKILLRYNNNIIKPSESRKFTAFFMTIKPKHVVSRFFLCLKGCEKKMAELTAINCPEFFENADSECLIDLMWTTI